MSQESETSQRQQNKENLEFEQNATKNNSQTPPQKLDGEELKEAIRKQIEFYLSRHNLSSDAYLVSHMGKDMFVPLEVIAKFQKVKYLTEDLTLIVESLKMSTQVTMDETKTKIRPNFTLTRSTVILRDIPATTAPEDVKKLFASSSEPKELRSDIGNIWYATFETETKALESLEHLRQQTFNSKPVNARIKSENLLKSAYSSSYPQQPNAISNQGMPVYGSPSVGYHGAYPQQWGYQDQGYEASYGRYPRRGPYKASRGGRRSGGGSRDGANYRRKNDTASDDGDEYLQTKARYPGGKSSGDYQRGKRLSSKRGGKKHSKQAPPTFSVDSFPPLPTLSKGEIEKSGYKASFLRYDKKAIIETFTELKDQITKPNNMPNCIAVTSSPISELELTKPLPKGYETPSTGIHAHEEADEEEVETLQIHSEPSVPATPPPPAKIQHFSIGKSFAEVAITAKDIKTPDMKREVIIARRDSLKEERKRSGSLNKNHYNQNNEKHHHHHHHQESSQDGHKKRGGRRNNKDNRKSKKKIYVETSNENNTSDLMDMNPNSYAAIASKAKQPITKDTNSNTTTTTTNSTTNSTTGNINSTKNITTSADENITSESVDA